MSTLKKEYDRLRHYFDMTPSQATKVAKFRAAWINHIGDVTWEDYGGGPVYKSRRYPGQFRLDYVQPPESSEYPYWDVYTVDLDKRMLRDYLDKDNAKKVASYSGQSLRDIARALKRATPMDLAYVAELIGGYFGWGEIGEMRQLTRRQFTMHYGEEPSEPTWEMRSEPRHKHGHGAEKKGWRDPPKRRRRRKRVSARRSSR